jgi:hypothetical protein
VGADSKQVLGGGQELDDGWESDSKQELDDGWEPDSESWIAGREFRMYID